MKKNLDRAALLYGIMRIKRVIKAARERQRMTPALLDWCKCESDNLRVKLALK